MKYPFLVIAILLAIGCAHKKPSPTAATNATRDTVAAAKQYFPVMDFIKSEIAYVDSLPIGIKKYTIRGTKKDSGYIRSDEFHRLASEFLPREMNDSIFQNEFRETSFFDQSSNTATFLYTARKETLPLQRVDVLSARGDVYDHVKSIYLQKSYRSGDTGITKKLFWRPQRSFQVITQASRGSGEPVTEIINVVWDNREE